MNFAEHTVDVHKQGDKDTGEPVNVWQKVLYWGKFMKCCLLQEPALHILEIHVTAQNHK